MKWFIWANIMGILLGVMLMLFAIMFDDPRRVRGRKRGKK